MRTALKLACFINRMSSAIDSSVSACKRSTSPQHIHHVLVQPKHGVAAYLWEPTYHHLTGTWSILGQLVATAYATAIKASISCWRRLSNLAGDGIMLMAVHTTQHDGTAVMHQESLRQLVLSESDLGCLNIHDLAH